MGYVVLLTYVRGLIIDRFQADPAPPDQVFSVFGGYILALLIVYAVSQALSKLQDYSVYRLEINGNYKLGKRRLMPMPAAKGHVAGPFWHIIGN
ncbi:MAG: hypothetical protein ACFNZW_04310 [Coriobacteriaceae bacterium]